MTFCFPLLVYVIILHLNCLVIVCLFLADLHAVLDVAKVADSLVFVLDSTEGWDSYGEYCLSSLFAQGLPSHGECWKINV